MTIAAAGPDALGLVLGGPGLILDYGSLAVRVRSPLAAFASQLHQVYSGFPLTSDAAFCDIDAVLKPVGGMRRLLRPQVQFLVDGVAPFEAFPADTALPLFEWGINWTASMRMNQHLLLHAGAVAQDGRAAILAAVPGAGKSTLTAALMLSGFRLLSDEFGVVRIDSGEMQALIKPVALKNQSIELIRNQFPNSCIGPSFPKTRKGAVAHLAPDAASIAMRHAPALPALIVFPRYQAGTAIQLVRMSASQAFARLAFNSFNYHLIGRDGFAAVSRLVLRCPAYDLRYSRLDEAIDSIGGLLEPPSAQGSTAAPLLPAARP